MTGANDTVFAPAVNAIGLSGIVKRALVSAKSYPAFYDRRPPAPSRSRGSTNPADSVRLDSNAFRALRIRIFFVRHPLGRTAGPSSSGRGESELTMSGAGLSFWRCPKCSRRVPSRLGTCQCGFDRASSTEPIVDVMQSAPAREAASPGFPKWMLVVFAIALVGVGYYVVRTPAPDPGDSAIAQNLRRRREPPPQREVVYVPVPAPAAEPRPEEAATPTDLSAGSPSTVPASLPVARETPPPREPVSVAPVVQESSETEVDVRRRVGAQVFERHVAALSGKADQADIAWQRYREGCRLNVTSLTAVAGAADRDWLVVAGVNVTTQTWTEACAEAGTFFALVRQVRDGMCAAEDGARQSWVLPGTRRDIRHRYRLDWDGWDSACS